MKENAFCWAVIAVSLAVLFVVPAASCIKQDSQFATPVPAPLPPAIPHPVVVRVYTHGRLIDEWWTDDTTNLPGGRWAMAFKDRDGYWHEAHSLQPDLVYVIRSADAPPVGDIGDAFPEVQ